MKAPFPYFGGKSTIASLVWEALGDCPNYIEPFAGSLAVLLSRPNSHQWWEKIETVNDADGMIANYWRATKAAPDEVAHWSDWPVNENDLHARHTWLVGQKDSLKTRLEGDPEWYDAKVAGWWLWGICACIGGGWCRGKGPWQVVDNELVDSPRSERGQGIKRQRPNLSNGGMGINRALPHLGNKGMGINADWAEHLCDIMQKLSARLRRVRVCCGDWSRVCGFSPTSALGLTGVFLDPPYSQEGRDSEIYSTEMWTTKAVGAWARERGQDPLMRIVLCGYEGEHEMPGWRQHRWKAHGGYGSLGNGTGRSNSERECVWFSPHCQQPSQQAPLFEAEESDATTPSPPSL